ncbi:MAG: hypothetical protein ACRC18_07015 [Cetobacterium sp.]
MISRKVLFFNTEDEQVLEKRIQGNDIKEIEKKAHKLMNEADERNNKYYNLCLQSFNIPNWN